MITNRVIRGCPGLDLYYWQIYATPESWWEKMYIREFHLNYVEKDDFDEFEEQCLPNRGHGLYIMEKTNITNKDLKFILASGGEVKKGIRAVTRPVALNGEDCSEATFVDYLKSLQLLNHEIQYALTKDQF